MDDIMLIKQEKQEVASELVVLLRYALQRVRDKPYKESGAWHIMKDVRGPMIKIVKDE